jgi:hypothetical protein
MQVKTAALDDVSKFVTEKEKFMAPGTRGGR